MAGAFHRRIPLDLTRELAPQLAAMLGDPDPEIARWAEENLRFELERAMISRDMDLRELPARWNALYKEFLGLDVPDDRRGCLQDVHWSGGMIGYFPTYTLGTLHAAQLFEAAREALPGLDEGFARGEFRPLREWLNTHVHRHGRRHLSADLCKEVTGKPLSADPLMRHLEAKLRPMYGL